ncbi:hypothetical protein V8C34DRAFT_281822 [Trichoderma compactum]
MAVVRSFMSLVTLPVVCAYESTAFHIEENLQPLHSKELLGYSKAVSVTVAHMTARYDNEVAQIGLQLSRCVKRYATV